ncbi:MAG: hypothetical protein V2I45_00490 [Halieaceae bacterium]|jgi:hypothetical protein|nr:hypothetical protein [Halieaceae bacterium]
MAKQMLANVLDAKRMLTPLYNGLGVEASDVKVEENDAALYAVYIDDNDAPASLVAFDPHYCAYMGGALTMVPADAANEAASSGEFSELVMGNIHEVMNILSRLFMEGTSPHLRLGEVRRSAADLTDAEKAVLEGAADRLDMKMTLPQYGDAHCSLITL